MLILLLLNDFSARLHPCLWESDVCVYMKKVDFLFLTQIMLICRTSESGNIKMPHTIIFDYIDFVSVFERASDGLNSKLPGFRDC